MAKRKRYPVRILAKPDSFINADDSDISSDEALVKFKDNIFFIHIPKTGGVSAGVTLINTFDEKNINPKYHFRELFEDNGNISGYRILAGHHPYFVSGALKQPLFTFTFLRDPIPRTLSLFNFIRSRPSHEHHQLLKKEADNILAFVEHDQLSKMVWNLQTRYIGAEIDFALLLDMVRRKKLSAEEANIIAKSALDEKTTDEIYERALQRLGKMPFVGVTERFQDSLRVLSHLLGFKSPVTTPRENVAAVDYPKVEDLTDQEREAICRSTRYDHKLYAYSIMRLNEQLANLD